MTMKFYPKGITTSFKTLTQIKLDWSLDMADTLLDSDWTGFINYANANRRFKNLPNVIFLTGPEVDSVQFEGKTVKIKEYDVEVVFGGTTFVPSPNQESVTMALNKSDNAQRKQGNYLITIRDWNFIHDHSFVRTRVFTRYSVTQI
jgi:hypothetical protein